MTINVLRENYYSAQVQIGNFQAATALSTASHVKETSMLQTIDGILRQTNLANESEDYLSKREELRLAEIELRNQRERVAELRRKLPKGPAVQDYIFEEVAASLDSGDSPIRTVRLSQLFTRSNRSLAIYQFMYGKKQTKPCPMCTAWIDGFN